MCEGMGSGRGEERGERAKRVGDDGEVRAEGGLGARKCSEGVGG